MEHHLEFTYLSDGLRARAGELLALHDAALVAEADRIAHTADEDPAWQQCLHSATALPVLDRVEQIRTVMEHLPATAGPGPRTLIVGHLDRILAGTLDVLALTALGHADVADLVVCYRSYQAAATTPQRTTPVRSAPGDVHLGDIPGLGAWWPRLRDAGVSWQSQMRQLTVDELRNIVGDDGCSAALMLSLAGSTSVLAACPVPELTAMSGTSSAPTSAASGSLERRHIAHLKLSVRTYNVLMREGLERVGDVLAIEDEHQLLRMRGFGVACLEDLRERLRNAGADPLF